MSRSGPAVRRIGPLSASVLVVANMVGAGVFTTSGFALADVGDRRWVLLAWLVGGLLALCGALSYGALARAMPESGGEYHFLSRIVHPAAGFVAGWISLLAGFTAPIAAAALALEAYLGPAAPALPPRWLGTAAILVAVAMHGLRLRGGLVVQNAVVAGKLVLIVGLVAFGGWRIGVRGLPPATAPVPFEPARLAVTLVWISFAYSGWNAAVYVAGEVRDPRKNLARSLLGATLAVTLCYLGLNAVFLYAAPVGTLAGAPDVAAVAAEALGGARLRTAVGYLVATALFTSISSMVMAGPRVYARMAEDGLFPALFSPRGGIPRAAVALQGALAIAVLWIGALARLLGYIGFTLGLCAAATVTSLLVLRRREGRERVPIPGFPFVPVVFVVATLAISAFMAARRPFEAGLGLATVAAGLPLYRLVQRLFRG